jgi:hypothetical protein
VNNDLCGRYSKNIYPYNLTGRTHDFVDNIMNSDRLNINWLKTASISWNNQMIADIKETFTRRGFALNFNLLQAEKLLRFET